MVASSAEDIINVVEGNVASFVTHLIEAGNKEAFYVCDIAELIKKYEDWKIAMPRVKPHYAVKSNSTPVILDVLSSLGAGFDCASKQEIQQVLSIGVNPNRIIFANPAKLPDHIIFAASSGVSTLTFDSTWELHKIKQYFPRAKAVIRIKTEDPLHKFLALSKKFGCDPETEAPGLLELAKNLNIEVIGVSFHVGTPNNNPPVYRDAIESASKVFKLGLELGFRFTLLDIGGGFPGTRGSSISETAEIVNGALDEFFPDAGIRVISEPGRYFVTSAFTLATNVHSIKSEDLQSEKYYHYYMDTGVFNCFLAVFMDKKYVAKPLLEDSECRKSYLSTIWGPTCDSYDKICENVKLPELRLGEWITFENVGAYTLCYFTGFNGFSSPNVYSIVDEKNWLLLKDKTAKNKFLCLKT